MLASMPAGATVIEYDGEGKSVISNKRMEIAAVQPSNPNSANDDKTAITELARTVAIQFSGETGVRKAGLDALSFVDIFEALIGAESGFDPRALSPKGAQGLGQLMPGTAEDMKVFDPFDPHQNLVGSAKYFTRLLHEFGSLELALAAYNAGPERVRQHKGVPPFRETQNYIARILNASGLSPGKHDHDPGRQASVPVNNDQPVKGSVSVWEF